MSRGKKATIASLLLCWLVLTPVAAVNADTATVRLLVKTTRPGLLHYHAVYGSDFPLLVPLDRASATNGALAPWRVIEVATSDVDHTITELHHDERVEQVHQAAVYRAALIPNDQKFSEQYGLASELTPGADINAPAAWDVTTGSPETIIAIVDGGFDEAHEDLRGKVWVNGDEVVGNGVDDDANGFIDDIHGWDFVRNQPSAADSDHGSHVAGGAAADSNNALGVAGVNWQARLMNVRVLGGSNLGFEDDIIRGLLYAAANGADIINVSLVGPPSPAMQDALERVYAQGAVVVAAAGNESADTAIDPAWPACARAGDGTDLVVGVAATNQDGEPASFSNYGDCVNVAAPGARIYGARRDNRYGLMTGTSMSSPLVAGAAGLYLALHPTATPADVIAAVSHGDSFAGTKAAEWNSRYKGKLNAAALVGAPASTPLPSPPPAPSPSASPLPAPTPPPDSPSAPSSDGGGGGDSGGGGGGGGGEEPAPTPQPKKPKVAGATHAKANLALLPRIKDTFRFVFGRVPTLKEKTYWASRIRRGEKRTYPALLGAMRWQQQRGTK